MSKNLKEMEVVSHAGNLGEILIGRENIQCAKALR